MPRFQWLQYRLSTLLIALTLVAVGLSMWTLMWAWWMRSDARGIGLRDGTVVIYFDPEVSPNSVSDNRAIEFLGQVDTYLSIPTYIVALVVLSALIMVTGIYMSWRCFRQRHR